MSQTQDQQLRQICKKLSFSQAQRDEKRSFLSGCVLKQKRKLLMMFYSCILLSSLQYLYKMQKHKMITKNYQHRERLDAQERELVKKGIVQDLDTSPSEENVSDECFSKYFVAQEENYSLEDFIMNLRAVDYRCYNEPPEDDEEMEDFTINYHPPIRCLERLNSEYLLAMGLSCEGRSTKIEPVEPSRVRFQEEMHVKFYCYDAPVTSIHTDEQFVQCINGHQMISQQSFS